MMQIVFPEQLRIRNRKVLRHINSYQKKRDAFGVEGAELRLGPEGKCYRAMWGGPQQTSIAVSRNMTARAILRIACSERKAKDMKE